MYPAILQQIKHEAFNASHPRPRRLLREPGPSVASSPPSIKMSALPPINLHVPQPKRFSLSPMTTDQLDHLTLYLSSFSGTE
jgi:hypothetical protein